MKTPRTEPHPTGLGQALRAARTERGLSLAELQARTKVRARFLTALEEERFGDLPPYPFARGFVHTVASELGVNPLPLLDRLAAAMAPDEAAQMGGWRRLDAAIEPAVKPSRARRLLMWTIALVVIVGGAVAIDFAMQMRELSRPAVAPPVSTDVGPPSTASPVGTPADPAAVVPVPDVDPRGPHAAPEAPPAGIAVDLEASGRSWVRVVADDQEVFVGFLTADQRRVWEGRESVAVRLGNAGAVAVTVNGRALGPMGAPGEVVTRVFRRDDAP